MRLRVAQLLCLGIFVGCTATTKPPVNTGDTTKKAQPQPAPTPPQEPTIIEPEPEPEPETRQDPNAEADPAHRCRLHDDCTNSCSLGAVNRYWYEIHYPDGDRCEDGCTSKGFEAPRCEQGTCVAYRQGSKEPSCTQQPVKYRAVEIPKKFSCSTAKDCHVTCSLGAINQAYFESLTDFRDCRDGCSSVGTDWPQCQNGLCVSYRLGNPSPHCTQREDDN